MDKDFSKNYISLMRQELERFDHDTFNEIVSAMLEAYETNSRIFIMGNGGSAALASHAVCDVNKGCCLERDKKFKMMCLNDNIPSMLALANDLSYETVFVEQLKNFFEPGDLVIGISGSGNSENVLQAIQYANENGGKTIGLSGFSGGTLAGMVDIAFVANVDDMQKVEDIHCMVVHIMMQAIYAELN